LETSIHVARPEDASRVADLLQQLGYPVSEADAALRIALYSQSSYRLLIAKIEDMTVGFIALHIYHALHLPAPEGRIISFCVDEKVRGTGAGTTLLHAAEDFFKEKKCFKIVLNCNLKRPDTHQYYLNRGYKFTSKHFARFLMEP
jgi:GNAT superfamily N-acetyltransferase